MAGAGLAGLLAAAPAAAQGNVLALVDGMGDLRVFGDAEGNGLVVLYELDTGELVISGSGGTTVNGRPEIRPHVPGSRFVFDMGAGDDRVRFAVFDVGGCCNDRDIVFYGGEGDDLFFVGDEQSSLDGVFADMGPGNDRFWAGEGGLIGELHLVGGEGDDLLDGFFSFMSAGALVELGPGNDRVDLREHVVREAFVIDLGTGADTIVLDSTFFRETLVISTGEGDDLVEIVESLRDDGDAGPVLVDTGAGVDRILLGGEVDVGMGVSIEAGDDADLLTIEGARIVHGFEVSLGAGDDRLRLHDSDFLAGSPAFFDGAAGVDRYVDLGGNRFGVTPDVVRFEARARKDPPTPSMSTTFASRAAAPSTPRRRPFGAVEDLLLPRRNPHALVVR